MHANRRSSWPMYLFVAILLAGTLDSCNVFPKIKNTARDALAEGVQKARIDSLLKAATDSVLTEMTKTEHFKQLRVALDTVLHQTTDTLTHATDALMGNVLKHFTKEWLPVMGDSIQSLLSKTKANLTDDQLKNYITNIVRNDLPNAVNVFIDKILRKTQSKEFRDQLADLRALLDRHLDTLSRSATRGVISVVNDSLLPKINLLLDKLVRERDKTQKGASSLIWEIMGGIVAVIIIAFLIRTFYLKSRYRRMLQLITQEVDNISSQKVYDELVRKVSEKMKAEGLESTLRDDILKEQGLIEQPKWEEKNAQLLRVLIKELELAKLPEDQIRAKLKEYGLEDHFESVKQSIDSEK